MNVTVKKLETTDIDQFIDLVNLFGEVFEMRDFIPPATKRLQQTLDHPGFMAFVAMANKEMAGGLSAYILAPYYSEKPLAYIFDLAVLSRFQRQKIGTTLITHLKDYCRDRGFEEVFVQADVVDDYALQFYRSTGITEEEDVRHFYYSLSTAH
jgi:aminoglycoside 3-N-acetyltransferase I